MRLAWFLVAVMILSPFLTIMSEPAAASVDTDYLGRTVQINSFDSLNDVSQYGVWTLSCGPTSGKWLWSYSAEGSHSVQLILSQTAPTNQYLDYTFTKFSSVPMSRMDTIQFTYSADDSMDNMIVYAYVEVTNAAGGNLRNNWEILQIDNNWHVCTFSGLNAPGATNLTLSIEMYAMHPEYYGDPINSTVNGYIALDDFRAISPVCNMRFSFYNYYTGLGQTSEILIPEVWYRGTWYRIWNNEISIAQGELVDYRVTDYFGQVVTWVHGITLDESISYYDIPVKLVKVHIAKPDWWTSNLPPEWQLAYLQSGVQVNVEGWDLEVLAGWYHFSWQEQIATNKGNGVEPSDDDLVVQNGSVDQILQGNETGQSDFQLSNFFLQMTPTTVSETQYGKTNIIPPGLDTWQGWVEFLGSIAKMLMNNNYYLIIVVGIGLVGVFGFLWKNGKTVAQTVVKTDKPKKDRNPIVYANALPQKNGRTRRRRA